MNLLLFVALVAVVSVPAEAGPLVDSWHKFRAHIRELNSNVPVKPVAASNTTTPVRCALCGIAASEVLGFIRENRTEAGIEAALKDRLCNLLSGNSRDECDNLVNYLPRLVSLLESGITVSGACIAIGLCEKPLEHHADFQPVPTYAIDLDTAPIKRFTQICAIPKFKTGASYLLSTLESVAPELMKYLGELGRYLNDHYLPTEYAQEIQGCATSFGIDYGFVTIMNMAYELTDACTSIVATASDGAIIHGRNLDFGIGGGFTSTLKDLIYQANWMKGGKLLFQSTMYAGYFGVLSGQRQGAFGITVDDRFYSTPLDLLEEILIAIEEKGATLVSFAVRDALEQSARYPTYASARQMLATVPLISNVYYIVSGVSAGQGTVLARNWTHTAHEWALQPTAGTWYTGITNYDRTSAQPWFDDRWDPINGRIRALGQTGMNTASLTALLGMKPTLNLETTYSILMVPSNGSYAAHVRWCQYPCVE